MNRAALPLVLIVGLVPTAALAQQSAAVSAPTLTVDGSGGATGGSPSGFFSATGTVPVGDSFGFQADGQLGQAGDRGQGGGAAHLFYRDPDAVMVGATAMWARIGGWNAFRYGAEAEAYLGDVTLSPSAGLQRGDANKGTAPSGYAGLDISLYATPNLKFTLGGSGFASTRDGVIAAEWQPAPATPLTLFAEAGGGNAGAGFALAGLRFTFGAPGSSLQQRDRHGDPVNALSAMTTQTGNALAGAASAVAQQKACSDITRLANQVATALPTGCVASSGFNPNITQTVLGNLPSHTTN